MNANPTLDAWTAWFDPAKQGRLLNNFPELRWFIELMRGVARAPLTPVEKAQCALLNLKWVYWHRRSFFRGAFYVLGRIIRPGSARLRPSPGDLVGKG